MRAEELRARCEAQGLGQAPAGLPASLAWALDRLPQASEYQLILIYAWLEHCAQTASAEQLETELQTLDRLDALHRHRRGRAAKSLWLSVAETLDQPGVWMRLVAIALDEDPSAHAAYRYTEAALRVGEHEAALVETAVRARLQHGRVRAAARLLRKQANCPKRDLLWHLVTKSTPLPEPACRCASASEDDPSGPDRTWLKCFFSSSCDMHTDSYSLCLSCHQVWLEHFHFESDPGLWYRVDFSSVVEREFWASRVWSPYPGRRHLKTPQHFARWVLALRECATAYTGI